MIMKKWIVSALFLFFALASYAQAEQPQTRKKVGVVLSGGGAKGVAHIGALKVLERAGIPVDIVTGTSMGSIIGGLYSIGYNAELMDSIVRDIDWSTVLSDKENLQYQRMSERKKQNTYIYSRAIMFKGSNVEDGGLITGKNLGELFENLTAGYNDSINFNQLPIPFACVATNIVDNTEYVFHKGYLPHAMRASMAIPMVFSPVRLGDMVLVDGGLRNNYPVDIAREMGAEIIIGVTVQEIERKTADDLSNTSDVLLQLIDVNCYNKYEDNLAMTDLAIRVDTKGYNAASFSKAAIDTLISRGENKAMEHWDDLMALKSKIGISNDYKPTILQPLNLNSNTEEITIQSLEFQNMTANDERFLRAKFHLKEGGTISPEQAKLVETSMRVDLFYKTASSRIIQTEGGCKVVFKADQKKNSQLSIGGRFDTEEIVAMQLNADFPIRASVPADIDITARLGRRMMGRIDLALHPRSFTRPSLSYIIRYNDINIFQGGEKDYNVTYNQHTVNLSLLNFYRRNFDVSFSAQWDYYHFRDLLINREQTGGDEMLENDHYISYRADVNYISEDTWYFPTRGARFIGNFTYHTDDFAKMKDDTGLMDVSAMWRKSWTSGRFTFQPTFYGRLLFGDHVPYALRNIIGGQWFGHYVTQQMPFAGVGHVEFTDQHFVGVQLQGQYRMGGSHYLLLRLAGAQHAPKFSELMDHKTMLGGSVSYYYNTMLGPMGATMGYSNKTHELNLYINLGLEF